MNNINLTNPDFQKRKPVPEYMTGERMNKLSTYTPSEAKSGQTLKIRMSDLTCNSDECTIPESFCLEFNFVNSNTKSRFLNNLSRLLTKHLQVRIGDEIVYDNTRESTLNLYRDLWLSENTRKKLVRYGVANVNTRKLMSGDDSGSDTATTDGIKDKEIAENYTSFKLRLGQILSGHGPYSPSNMNLVVEYQITLPAADEIMEAQSSQSVGTYTIKNLRYRYETIRSKALVDRSLSGYLSSGLEKDSGKILNYKNFKVQETPDWDKDSTEEIVNIRISRKSLACIVGVFRYVDQIEDEDFIFPNIDKVSIEINGDPNKLYSSGLVKDEMYDECRKLFEIKGENVTPLTFFKNRYSLVLDFRTVSDNNAFGSGINTKDGGVNLVITKKVTPKNVKCTFFAFSEGVLRVTTNDLMNFTK